MSYKEIMSSKNDLELIQITSIYRDEYNPEAVIAAEEELSQRSLTEEQLTALREDLIVTHDANIKQSEGQRRMRKRLNEISDLFISRGKKTGRDWIKIIGLGVLIIYFFDLSRILHSFSFTMSFGNAQEISQMIFFILFVPFSLTLFWMKRSNGWYLIGTFLIGNCIYGVSGVFLISKYLVENGSQPERSNFNPFFIELPTIDYAYLLQMSLILVYFLVHTYKLLSKDVMGEYQLKSKSPYIAIALGIIYGLVLIEK